MHVCSYMCSRVIRTYLHINIDTCILTYIHTLRTYKHAHLHIHTCVCTCMRALACTSKRMYEYYVPAFMRTYIHPSNYPVIHWNINYIKYIHYIYIHSKYIHTYIITFIRLHVINVRIKNAIIFTNTMFLLNVNGYRSDMPISGNYLKSVIFTSAVLAFSKSHPLPRHCKPWLLTKWSKI
jgi:hypothetical protein